MSKKCNVILVVATITMLFCFSSTPTIAFDRWPDTGQTTSYTDTFGEDSDYTRNSQSYTKLGHGGVELSNDAIYDDGWLMTRDNVTGLIWDIHYTTVAWNFSLSESYLNTLNSENFGGFADWRLPTIKELSTILNNETYNPAFDPFFFQNIQMEQYWTSTLYPIENPYDPIGTVDFSDSDIRYETSVFDTDKRRFIAVRNPQMDESTFIDNGDGTVTDTGSGLMWLKATNGPMNWESAINYSEALTHAGYHDWRLPNKNELQSIIDYSNNSPSIDVSLFPNSQYDYWSSTTVADTITSAWMVHFDFGFIVSRSKLDNYYVRPVRTLIDFPEGPLEPVVPSIDDPIQAEPIKDKLIVLIHGWQNSALPISTINDIWVSEMENVLDAMIANGDIDSSWAVEVWDWIDIAYAATPIYPVVKGIQEGKNLAKSILDADNEWQHVHFIAHSAGFSVLDAASLQLLDARDREDGSFSGSIHLTTLDPYVFFPAYENHYAERLDFTRDWADNYYSIDALTYFGNTDINFEYANNKDLSLADGWWNSHSFPHEWYHATITGVYPNGESLNDDNLLNGVRFGFPRALVASELNWQDSLVLPRDYQQMITTTFVAEEVIDFTKNILQTSLSGSVITSSTTLTLETGSPVWTHTLVDMPENSEYISFTYQFNNPVEGYLTAYFNGHLILLGDKRLDNNEVQESGKIFVGDFLEKDNWLTFRMDAISEGQAQLTVSDINLITGIVGGDINGDSNISLEDSILTLKIVSGIDPDERVYKSADVDDDGKIGMAEAIFGLKAVADNNSPFGTVISAGQIWMDRNLGARRVATSSTDPLAYGDYYQWGRLADGHESRTSPTTTTLSNTDVPIDGNFITQNDTPWDWRNPQNANLWLGVSGINNPCPSGYRLPTKAEWETEIASWISNNSAGAHDSPLKLVEAGWRASDGEIVNSSSGYWSSSVNGSNSVFLYFHSNNASVPNGYRGNGHSIRCIKD